jgi:hypothetical protein
MANNPTDIRSVVTIQHSESWIITEDIEKKNTIVDSLAYPTRNNNQMKQAH